MSIAIFVMSVVRHVGGLEYSVYIHAKNADVIRHVRPEGQGVALYALARRAYAYRQQR